MILKNKFMWILGGVLTLILIIWMVILIAGDNFEKMDRNYIDIPNFPDLDRDPHISTMYDTLQADGINFNDIYSSLSNRFIPTYYNSKYWVVTTGVTTIDDGMIYFFVPTYSRILVIDRNTRKIVINKLFFKNITNVLIEDNYIYFVYTNIYIIEILSNLHQLDEIDEVAYKLGRFKFKPPKSSN